jgi:hypothetical protein
MCTVLIGAQQLYRRPSVVLRLVVVFFVCPRTRNHP